MGKSVKTVEERLKIKQDVLQQMDRLNVDVDVLESFQPFMKILDEYCQPKLMNGYSGRLYIPEINRVLEYVLPLRVWAQPMVRLVQRS